MSISGVISSSNTPKTLLRIAQNQHFTQKQKFFRGISASVSNKSRIFAPEFGKVAEWFIATTACRCGPQGPGGSNPSLSALRSQMFEIFFCAFIKLDFNKLWSILLFPLICRVLLILFFPEIGLMKNDFFKPVS